MVICKLKILYLWFSFFLFSPSFFIIGVPDFPDGPRAGQAGLDGVTGPELFLLLWSDAWGNSLSGQVSTIEGPDFTKGCLLPVSPSKFLCQLLLRSRITTIPAVDVVPRMPLCPHPTWEACEYFGTREVPWSCAVFI